MIIPSKRRAADLRSGMTSRQDVDQGVVGGRGYPVTSVTPRRSSGEGRSSRAVLTLIPSPGLQGDELTDVTG